MYLKKDLHPSIFNLLKEVGDSRYTILLELPYPPVNVRLVTHMLATGADQAPTFVKALGFGVSPRTRP